MKVKNNDVRLITLGGGKLNLVPGLNQVEDKLWTECTANPGAVLKHLFKEKLLEVLDAPKGAAASAPEPDDEEAEAPPAKTGDENLSELKADEAISLVAECLDRDTLEAWKRGERRKTVLEAIEQQLELTKV